MDNKPQTDNQPEPIDPRPAIDLQAIYGRNAINSQGNINIPTRTSTSGDASAALNNIDLPQKKKYAAIAIIIGLLLAILLGVIFVFDNIPKPIDSKYTYIDINKKCPALKDNIAKISVSEIGNNSLVLTNSGDLYAIYGIKTPAYPTGGDLGSCLKIDELSGVKDITRYFDSNGSVNYNKIKLSDGSIKAFDLFVSDGDYSMYDRLSAKVSKGRFPLEDEAFAANVAKYKISKYYALDDGRSLFFVDPDNNVYNDKFSKVIDGKSFGSEIRIISVDNSSKDINIASDNYVYTFSNISTYNLANSQTPKTSTMKLTNTATNFYGVKTSDIRQIIYSEGYKVDKEGYYYVITNGGMIYRFESKVQTSDVLSAYFANPQILYLALIVYIVCLAVMIILAYRGENSGFFAGLGKLILAVIILLVVAVVIRAVQHKAIDLSLINVGAILVSTFVYFVQYFIIKKVVWMILHKTNINSKLVFALVYALVSLVIAVIAFKTIRG